MALKPIPLTADGSGPKGAIPIAVEGVENPVKGAIPVEVHGAGGGGEDPWIPRPGVGEVTSTSDMFNSPAWQSVLTRVGGFDTSNVTGMSSMFFGCSSLESVPPFDTSNVFSVAEMFSGCSSLAEIELTDCSGVIEAYGLADQASSLERLTLPGISVSFSLQGSNMSAPALNDLFDSIGQADGSQSINITGSPGAGDCDESIATAKGWTIVK